MFTKWLIRVGIIVTPYFVWGSRDVRDIKLEIAGILALGIALSAIYEYGIRPMKNRWIMWFVWFACSSYLIAPRCALELWGMDISLFWIWQPMYYILVFALMIFSVSSIPLSTRDMSSFLRVMTWSAFIMACYIILQYFRMDQIFRAHTDATYGRMAGFVGNPTHVSPYIAMIIPIALYLRRRFMALIMAIGVLLTTSAVAIVAMGASLMCYLMMQGKRGLTVAIFIILAVCILTPIGVESGVLTSDMVADHQRLVFWKAAVTDLVTPQLQNSPKIYPLTGLGIGTFKYLFHFQHQNSFWQAHNDYVELAYNLGLIGFGLFIMMIILFLHRNISIGAIFHKWMRIPGYRLRTALVASFICMLVTAMGTFIWQIGTTAFYTCLVVGLLNNNYLGGRT